MNSLRIDNKVYDKFIANFLSWYQDSFSQSDVVNEIGMQKLVKQAEEIHTQRLLEREAELLIAEKTTVENTLKTLKNKVEKLKKQGKIKGRLLKYTKKHTRK